MSLTPNQPVRRVRAGFIIAAIIFGFGAAVPVGQGLLLQVVFLVVSIALVVAGLRAPPSNPREVLDQISKEREQKRFQ
jgi:hypothetical protein